MLMNHQNRSVQDGALRQYSGLSNGMRFSQAWMHFLRYSLRFPSKAIQPQAFAAAAFPLHEALGAAQGKNVLHEKSELSTRFSAE